MDTLPVERWWLAGFQSKRTLFYVQSINFLLDLIRDIVLKLGRF